MCVLLVILFDKFLLKDIECVLNVFDFGIILVNDGFVICLVILVFIEEICCDFVKEVKKVGENVKVVVCNICCDVMDEVKK